MKNSILFAALLGTVAATAQAEETSVTLYGVADGGYGVTSQSVKVDGEKVWSNRNIGARSGIQAGNRWGLKGSHDLGNGTSAIFQLESGFDLNTGVSAQGGRLFGRRAVVGLTGDSWGTFTIGRQYPVADDFVSKIDPFGKSFSQASANRTFADSVGVRRDNVLKYLSPSFSGFSFGVSLIASGTENYTSETGNEVKTRDTAIGLGAGYKNGPLTVAASFDYERNKQTTNGVVSNRYNTSKTSWVLGGTYDFEPVKLHLMYGQQRNGVIAGNFGLAGTLIQRTPAFKGYNFNSQGVRTQAWLVGLSAKLSSANRVIFSYQGGRIKHADLGASLGTVRINSQIWSLAYVHSLSKRTSLYAVGSYGQFKAKFGANNAQRAKLKSTEATVGLTHRF